MLIPKGFCLLLPKVEFIPFLSKFNNAFLQKINSVKLTYQGARCHVRIIRAQQSPGRTRAVPWAYNAHAVLIGRVCVRAQRNLLQDDRNKREKSIFANVVRVVLGYQWPTANAWGYSRGELTETTSPAFSCPDGCERLASLGCFSVALLHCVGWLRSDQRNLSAKNLRFIFSESIIPLSSHKV